MKILSLNNIKAGVMASVVALSAASCGDLTNQRQLCDNAENNAMEYLNGEEYLQAKKDLLNCCSYSFPNKLVNYWDSINTDYKVKRAYLEGTQMVKDSVAGKDYKRTEYKTPRVAELKIDHHGDLVKNLTNEVASNTDARTIRQFIENEPQLSTNESSIDMVTTKGYKALYYWKQVISTVKQREAFNNGANTERAKLNK